MTGSISRLTTIAILGLSASARYSYSCEDECPAGCDAKTLTPWFNNAEWFSKEVLRCATHSFNATLEAQFDLTINAVGCRDTHRAYFTFPAGMEDFWTFSEEDDLKVNTFWLGRHVSEVKTYFTNSADPCTTTDLNGEWPVMSSESMISRGKKIGYKTMVFTGLNDDFVKNVESISATFTFHQEPLATFKENSWYQCEAGCCFGDSNCSNSEMHSVVGIPSFLDQADKCINAHKTCLFTISRQVKRDFAVGEVYICSKTDLSFPLNLSSPYFVPLENYQMELDLSPPAVSFDTLRAYYALEPTPCTSAPLDPWLEIKQVAGLTWEVAHINNEVTRKPYGLLRFDHYQPYDLLSLSIPVRYGSLPDDN